MLPLLLARRFLSRTRGGLASFIIRLAIMSTALGVAVMIVALSLINGFQEAIQDKLFSFWGGIQIAPYTANPVKILRADPLEFDPQLFDALKAATGVRSVTPFIVKPGILQHRQSGGDGAILEGIQLKGLPQVYNLPSSVVLEGSRIPVADSGYSSSIILSNPTALRLNAAIGDTIRLYFMPPGAIAPRIRKLRICGLYHTGMEDLDRHFALCDIRLLQRLAGWESSQISGYQLDLENLDQVNEQAERIHAQYLRPPLYAYSLRQTYDGIFDWLGMQDINARILLIIVGIVALINHAAAMLFLIIDRTVTVGVLNALGMPAASLRAVFLYLAGLIGGWGILIGNVVGIGLCLLQQNFGFVHLPEETYYMRTAPISIPVMQVLLLNAAALLLILCAALPPLFYLRRAQPARVLRFD